MELLLGSHVREHGTRVGRLAGFDLEPATRRIRRIAFSADGDLGFCRSARPLFAISHVHDDGEIDLRTDIDIGVLHVVSEVVLVDRATRLTRAGHDQGHLMGAELNPVDGQVLSVFGRPHWWSKRVTLDGAELDGSTPGEIRAGTPPYTRAA